MTPSQPTPRRPFTQRLTHTLVAAAALALLMAPPAIPSQVLARPGWAGSGISTDLWWKHAIIYQINPINFSPTSSTTPDTTIPPGTPIHNIIQRLDYIHSLGADAILLTALQPDPTHAQEITPALGTLDDLDDLIHESSRRNIRILLDLDPIIPVTDLPNVARFWLNRGIAGFHVAGTNDAAHAQAAILRKATNGYLGQRILIGDVDLTLPPSPRQRTYRAIKAPDAPTPHLLLDTRYAAQPNLTASTIRPTIDAIQDNIPPTLQPSQVLPLLATDGPTYTRSFTRYADTQHDTDIAKVLATILLATRGNTLLYYGQELGAPTTPDATPLITWDAPPPPAKNTLAPTETATPNPIPSSTPNAALEDADPNSLLNWYRQLITLHRSNATIANGQTITINQDDKNILAWIRKPQAGSALNPPLVIVCNLTAQPVTLSLKADIVRLHLRGSFLRTILRSDKGMGTMHLESMTIAPYTAYIGQLRY